MLDRILNTLLILNQKIFFVGQSRWFWDTQIEYAANRTDANIFCTSEIFHAFAFVNTFSPHLLLLFVLNIYFNWDVFFKMETKKSLRLPCIKFNLTIISLKGYLC